MNYENLIFEQLENGIFRITLNRPGSLNALSSGLCIDLMNALEKVANNNTTTVVIITGKGRAFSAGLDLKEECDLMGRNSIIDNIFNLISRMKVPVIAAVNGFAITGGFELALACDIIVSSESAVFRDTHAQANIIPGGGNTQRLPRVIGEKNAKALLFTSDFISASNAQTMGMVYKVVPNKLFEQEYMAMARSIAAQPVGIISKLKWMVNEGMRMNFGDAMEFERRECVAGWSNLSSREFMTTGKEVINQGRSTFSEIEGA